MGVFIKMSKKAQINISGFIVRMFGMAVIIFSLPFFVSNPGNIFSIMSLAFGNFLLAIGGAIN